MFSKYSKTVAIRIIVLIILPMTIYGVISIKTANPDANILILIVLMLLIAIVYYRYLNQNLGELFQEEIQDIKDVIELKETKKRTVNSKFRHKLDELYSLRELIKSDLNNISSTYEFRQAKYEKVKALTAEISESVNSVNMTNNLYTQSIKAIIEICPQYILLTDRNRNISFTNSKFLKRFSIDGDAIMSMSFESLFLVDAPPAHIRGLEAKIDAMFSGEKRNNIMVLHSAGRIALNVEAYPVGNGMMMFVFQAIEDQIKIKASLVRKHREMEYVNTINRSLINHRGTEELFQNIASKVAKLFSIKEVIIFSRTKDNFEVLSEVGSSQEISSEGLKDHYLKGVENMYSLEGSDSYYINSLLLDDEIEPIFMVLRLVKPIGENDISIINMFSSQASIVIQRARIYNDMRRRFLKTIGALVNSIDQNSRGKSVCTTKSSTYAEYIAAEMELSREEVYLVKITGLLYSLSRVAKKTDSDEKVSDIALNMLKNIDLDHRIKAALKYLDEEENCDNAADQTLYAGILNVANAFDNLTSIRKNINPIEKHQAVRIMKESSGTKYQTVVLDILEKLILDESSPIHKLIEGE